MSTPTSDAYVPPFEELFGEPGESQDHVRLEYSAMVTREDSDGKPYEVLTDTPREGDVPSSVKYRYLDPRHPFNTDPNA